MTEPFDAVLARLAEVLPPKPLGDVRAYRLTLTPTHAAELHNRFNRLAAARAAEIIGWSDRLMDEVLAHAETKARAEAAERDAGRWLAMREHMVAVDWKPEMGGGPVVMFECMAERVMAGPEGADAIADAAAEFAAIATTEQADEE